MFCGQCGTACLPEYRFCKNCGAAVGAPENGFAVNVPEVAAVSVPAVQAAGQEMQAMAPAAYQNVAASVPPPVPPVAPPGVYQAVPQPIYYVTQQAAAQAHTAHQNNLLSSLRGRIQSLASTESLEGFSLKDMFSEAFKRHGAAAVEDYMLVGTSKTTPPIEVVETGWPKPWLFFRLLAALVIAYVALTFLLHADGEYELHSGDDVPGRVRGAAGDAGAVLRAEYAAQCFAAHGGEAVSVGSDCFAGRGAAGV